MERNADETEEGDDGGGTAYDGLHGSRVSKTGGLVTILFYSRDLFSAAPVFDRSVFLAAGNPEVARVQQVDKPLE